MNDVDYTRNDEFYGLYVFVVSNKNLEYDAFEKKLLIEKKIGIKELLELITNNESFSGKRQIEMQIILKYIFSKKLDNIPETKKLKQEVDKIILPKANKGEYPHYFNEFRRSNYVNSVKKEDRINQIKNNLDNSINELRKSKDAVAITDLLRNIKRNLSYFSDEEYIDILIKLFDVERITLSNIDDARDLVLFAISSLMSDLGMLEYYNDNNEIDKIKELHVSKEETVDKEYLSHNLYNWKKREIQYLISVLNRVIETYDSIGITKDFSKLKKLSIYDLKTISELYPLISDDYIAIKNASDVYKEHILSLNNVADKRKRLIIEKYNKEVFNKEDE